jgi:tetratricopeptide (TPR) repeat protein
VPPTRAEIALRASKIGNASFYEILGVPPNATLEDIEGAYLRLSATWRADRLPKELDDVRDLCAQVQAQIDLAHKTLADPASRSRYDVTGGKARPSAPVDAAKVYREAEAALENGQLKLAEELCKRAYELAPDVGRYAAMLVWIDAQRSVDAPPEHNKPLILKLDRIIGDDPHCEEALFYRATLLKRVGSDEAAVRDFARVVALNPKHIDAAREVRLAEIRKKKR